MSFSNFACFLVFLLGNYLFLFCVRVTLNMSRYAKRKVINQYHSFSKHISFLFTSSSYYNWQMWRSVINSF